MVGTVYLLAAARERVECYIRANNPRIEHGGFLIGKDYTIIVPRFYPNVSATPEKSYQIEPSFRKYLQIDLNLFGMNFLADFHTHPTHSITSEADLKYAHGHNICDLNVVIAYDAQRDVFTWHAYDNAGQEQVLLVVDKNYNIFKEFFANSLDLTPIGDCFITPGGELLSNNPVARYAISVNAQLLSAYNYYAEGRHKYKTKGQVAQDLGVTEYALGRLLAELQNRGFAIPR